MGQRRDPVHASSCDGCAASIRSVRTHRRRAGYSVLSRNALTLLDVEGTYRATVFDEHDQPVGWWEVEVVEPFRPRVFSGSLPGTSPAAEAGLMLALNSEIDWIENHVLDVWRGMSGGRGGSHLGGVR